MYQTVLKELATHLRERDWQAVLEDHRRLRELLLSTPDDPNPVVAGAPTVEQLPDHRADSLAANIERNVDNDDATVRVRLVVNALTVLGR